MILQREDDKESAVALSHSQCVSTQSEYFIRKLQSVISFTTCKDVIKFADNCSGSQLNTHLFRRSDGD